MSDSEHNETVVPNDSSSNGTSQRKNISQEDVHDKLIDMFKAKNETIVDMFKELLLNLRKNTEGFAKVEATTQDINEKCEKPTIFRMSWPLFKGEPSGREMRSSWSKPTDAKKKTRILFSHFS